MRKEKEKSELYHDNYMLLLRWNDGEDDLGEFSDGYHTFNSLYHQRAILFATIVNLCKDRAWKSLKHSDGKYCFDREGEWFIVGIDTPKGSYTYHYETDKYWDLFHCEELELGKERDGHTDEDVDRLLSLENVELFNGKVFRKQDVLDIVREETKKQKRFIENQFGVNLDEIDYLD